MPVVVSPHFRLEHCCEVAGGEAQPRSCYRKCFLRLASLIFPVCNAWSQAFADVLQLPPFSLAALEAAIDPGPKLKAQQAAMQRKRLRIKLEGSPAGGLCHNTPVS